MDNTPFSMLPKKSAVTGPNAFLLTAASLVVVLAGLKAAEELLVPLVFAAFLAILTAPAVVWLEEKRVPPWVAVSIVLMGVLVALAALGTILGGSVNAFVSAIPRYQVRLNELLVTYANTFELFGFTVQEDSLRQVANPSEVMSFVGELITQLAAMLSDTALILLTMVFILLEVASIPRKLRRALGDPQADLSRYTALAREVKRYVVIKTYISAATGLLVGVFLHFIGVDFPVLWALVAFLLNYIPNIGSIIAAIPAVLLALVQFGLGSALVTAAGYISINMVMGNMLEPRLLGRKLGLSTLVVFLSLIFWGWLWGPMGMLLSVPLTMIVKILLESSAQFHSLAKLMDQPMSQGTPFPLPEEVRPTWDRIEPPASHR